MKKIIILLVILIFIFSCLPLSTALFINNCFSQWVQQLAPNHALRDIEFLNRYTGWACGDAMIYKTTNGGENWIIQLNPSQSFIQQIYPVNENLVYAVGWWTFMKTTNGGENWTSIFTGGPGSGLPILEGVYFINENTGWLCGTVVAMKTTDGGSTFTDSMRIESNVHDIYFKNDMEGVMSGMVAALYKTTNGGANWNRIYAPTTTTLYNFSRITFVNNQYGWVGGKVVYRTTDFGSTWDSIGTAGYPINEYDYCIEFSSMNIGYTGGTSGYMFKTTDGGFTWRQEDMSSFHTGYLRSIYAYNDSVLWAVGNGKILHTTNGGQVSVSQISTEIPEGFVLHQNYPNPFNPVTNIQFDLPNDVKVTIKVYDVLGKEVAVLVNEFKKAGSYIVSFNGSELSSGVYFYKIEAGSFTDIRRMVLIK